MATKTEIDEKLTHIDEATATIGKSLERLSLFEQRRAREHGARLAELRELTKENLKILLELQARAKR